MTNPSPTTPAITPIDELHVHDWSPWGPSPLAVMAGVERRRRSCRGCDLTQDEPTPTVPSGPVPDSGVFTHRVYWPCRTAQALGMVDPLDTPGIARGGEATE
jgi:hypothetical protein